MALALAHLLAGPFPPVPHEQDEHQQEPSRASQCQPVPASASLGLGAVAGSAPL